MTMKKGDIKKFTRFPGVDNVSTEGRYSVIDRIIFPQIIFNMYVNPDGRLIKREGYTEHALLTDAHSLISDSRYLFCGGLGSGSPESIWRIDSKGNKTEVGAIHGKLHPLYWLRLNDPIDMQWKLYISSKVWNGIYQYSTGTIVTWGTLYSDDPADFMDGLYSSERMLTLNVKPPNPMENLCFHGSRIWGSIGKIAYYSEPFAYGWFKDENRIEFLEELTLIATTPRGMYFASEDRTWFEHGMEPSGMKLDEVGDGALSGSLQYCDFQKLGEKVPVWTSKSGIQAGVDSGVKSLTTGRVRFDASGRVASMFRNRGGNPQYMANFELPEVQFGDSVTAEVIRAGKLV